MARLVIEVDTKKGQKSVEKLDDELKEVGKTTDKLQKGINKWATKNQLTFKKLAVAAAGLFALKKAKEYTQQLIKIADDYSNIDAKIRLVTSSTQEFDQVYEELFDLGRKTGSQLAVNAQAFSKLSNAMKDTSSGEIIGLLATVNKSLITAGATTQESSSFMLQFGQAMGSAVVAGDELKSMNESNSFLMAKIAKQLGTNISGLKKMGAAGTLTSKVFSKALKAIQKDVDESFAKMPITMARAANDMREVWKRILADSNKGADGTGSVAMAITDLAQVIDDNKEGIVSLFTSIITLSAGVVKALANIGESFAGWAAVRSGELSLFEFAIMDAEDFDGWLKEVNKDGAEVRKLMSTLDELAEKRVQAQLQLGYGPEAKAAKAAEIADIDATIAKLKEQVSAAKGGKSQIKLDIDTSKVKESLEDVNTAFGKSTKKWMDDTAKAATKSIKDYVDKIDDAQKDIAESVLDLRDELAGLSREGLTDEGAWDAVLESIKEYQKEAETAAKAGDWETQLDLLQRAKDLISELPTDGVKMIAVTDADVARAKAVADATIRSFKAHPVSSKGAAANRALREYEALQRAQKSGASDLITKQESLNTKSKLTQQIGEAIIETKKGHLDQLKKEKATLEETFQIYKEKMDEVGLATKGIEEETQKVGETWENVGGVWTKVSKQMVSEVDQITSSLNKAIEKLSEFQTKQGTSTTSNSNSFDISGARAGGGPVSAGKRYLVGEKGKEIFQPDTSGNIIPNNQINQAGSSFGSVDITWPSGNTTPITTNAVGAEAIFRESEYMKRRSSR